MTYASFTKALSLLPAVAPIAGPTALMRDRHDLNCLWQDLINDRVGKTCQPKTSDTALHLRPARGCFLNLGDAHQEIFEELIAEFLAQALVMKSGLVQLYLRLRQEVALHDARRRRVRRSFSWSSATTSSTGRETD